MSQPVKKITIHIKSKENHAMKSGWLIECNIFFFKNHVENVAERLVPNLFVY